MDWPDFFEGDVCLGIFRSYTNRRTLKVLIRVYEDSTAQISLHFRLYYWVL